MQTIVEEISHIGLPDQRDIFSSRHATTIKTSKICVRICHCNFWKAIEKRKECVAVSVSVTCQHSAVNSVGNCLSLRSNALPTCNISFIRIEIFQDPEWVLDGTDPGQDRGPGVVDPDLADGAAAAAASRARASALVHSPRIATVGIYKENVYNVYS